MRIRKQASKLLPLAPPPTPNHPSTLHHQNSHPHPKQQQPQPPPQQQQKKRHKKKDENNTHLEVSCNLNRSPWEALPLSLLLLHLDDATDDNSNSNLDVYFQQPLQGSAGGEASTIATATTAAAPSRFAGKIGSFPDPPVESKKRKNRIRYDNVDDDDDDKEDDDNCKKKMKKSDVALCKKSDGKGWNCKREAKKPYSLCDYHLSQIRSYYHGNNHSPLHQQQTKIKDDCNTAKKKKIDTGGGGGGGVAMVKPRRCVRRSVDTGPEFYYYYSGFGPWRGKKRGGGMKEEEVGDGCGDGGVGRNNIMVNGGDNCRSSSAASYHLRENGTKEEERCGGRRVEDDNGGIGVDPESIDDVDESSEGDDGEPSRVNWRRARKPVKARSLKSLL